MRILPLKGYLPRSLFPRAILILILPIILLQVVVGVVFVQRHYNQVTGQMTDSIAREISVALSILATSPTVPIAQARLNDLAQPLGIVFLILEDEPLPEADSIALFDLSGRALSRAVRDLVPRPLTVDLSSNSRIVDLRILTHMGTLKALVPRRRVTASNPHQLLVLMTATSLGLMVLAALFLRNQVRPVLALANAAEAFGKGRSERYQPAGADEVRRAGIAFLAMRARIERQIEQRTLMLSGVSHDLKTPLTRMKLSLALLDDEAEAAALASDVADMERMLEEFLAFARGDQSEDPRQIDAVALLGEIADQVERAGGTLHRRVALTAPEEPPVITVKESALRRAVTNLVSNAQRFGTAVELSLTLRPGRAVFAVEDNGPGIPEGARSEALKPFARLDSARSQNTGGNVGLGLAIAQDVARSHGGSLTLETSDRLGGLRAVLSLPR